MRKKVLLICYYFPPLGLGGIGRPLNLFKKLPQHCWDCDILTVKPVAYRAYEPNLLADLDNRRIFRSGSHDPQRLLYLFGVRQVSDRKIDKAARISERFFPDSKVGWVNSAVKRGRSLCERHKYDCIVSTSPPISSHLVGLRLQAETGIPWVADFRDFWTSYRVELVFEKEDTVARGKELLAEIAQATAVTVVNESIAQYLGAGELITNGYDSDLSNIWLKAPDKRVFTIGVQGHQLVRNEVQPLLDLLAAWSKHCHGQSAAVRILQVGQVNPSVFQQMFAISDMRLTVECHGRQTRQRTIELLSECHAFFLALAPQLGNGVLPSRTFELIASGRPIFAGVPADGEIARLLAGAGNAVCYEKDNVSVAVERFDDLVQAFRDGSYQYTPLTEFAHRYSSDEMAAKFATLMNRLL